MYCPELKLMELAICLVSDGEALPRFTEAQAEEGGTAGHGQVCSGNRELSRVTVVGHWEAVLGKMARVYARKNYSLKHLPRWSTWGVGMSTRSLHRCGLSTSR